MDERLQKAEGEMDARLQKVETNVNDIKKMLITLTEKKE